MPRPFTRIKHLSDERRLPRLGKIRLGEKVKNAQGKEYPRETPYFVVPEEVAKVYGEKPTRLDVMIPVDDQDTILPTAMEYYGSSRGLKCTGNMEIAQFYDEEAKAWKDTSCPCHLADRDFPAHPAFGDDKKGKCSRRAHLAVILHRVNMGGVYQIDTSSWNSIVDLQSSMDYVRTLIGRVAMVPLTLLRQETKVQHEGKLNTHYTMRIEFSGDADFINRLRSENNRILTGPRYALPEPEQENPALDDPTEEPGEEPAEAKGELFDPPSVDTLIGNFGACATADELNEIADLARSLNLEGEDRERLGQAYREAKQRIEQAA